MVRSFIPAATTAPSAPERPGPTAPWVVVPDAVVAVHATESQLTEAVLHLEHAGHDMASLSVLGRGTAREPHVIGFRTVPTPVAPTARWGGLWGWVLGALVVVPDLGPVAVGGHLLPPLLATEGVTAGILGGALTSIGIPARTVPTYEADLAGWRFLAIVHGTPAQVDHAHRLLARRAHERLDRHAAGR